MRFTNVFYENLHKTLKKIRIKVDPMHASFETFKDLNCYEGYILEENVDFVRVMVVKSGNPIVDIPTDALTEPTLLDHFKFFLTKMLRLSDTDPCFFNINNSTSFEDIEDALKKNTISDKELANLYKEFIKTHEKNIHV